jgi:hypothetical protein
MIVRIPGCPVCGSEKSSFLNLARHMVMSDRPFGEHQLWLQDFLKKSFPEYAFKHDKDIAIALKRYWTKYGRWPEDEFNNDIVTIKSLRSIVEE